MKNKVVRLTESDLEKLVKRIIKEDEFNPEMAEPKRVSTQDIRTQASKSRSEMGGLTQPEKQIVNRIQNLMKHMAETSGLQITGSVGNYFERFLGAYNEKNKTNF